MPLLDEGNKNHPEKETKIVWKEEDLNRFQAKQQKIAPAIESKYLNSELHTPVKRVACRKCPVTPITAVNT